LRLRPAGGCCFRLQGRALPTERAQATEIAFLTIATVITLPVWTRAAGSTMFDLSTGATSRKM
jgi:hypothetical protein